MFELIRFVSHVWNYNRVLNLSPERWQARQDERFRALIKHTHAHSAFYRNKWQGINPDSCRLQELPVVTKTELMANFNEVVTDSRLQRDEIMEWMSDVSRIGQYYLDQYVVCHTSGSQGQVAIVVQDREAPFHLFAMQVARGHAMPKTWGTLFKKIFQKRSRWAMVLFKPCFIPSGAAFGYMPKPSKKLADMLRLNLMDPFEENVRKLEEFQPNFITAYVHVLEQLARAAKEGKTSLAKLGCLQLVIAISEPLLPDTQKYIEQHLGVPVANHYAMGECPALSLGCPAGKGSHINTDMAILENVDDQYRPVPPGKHGSKVLLTNLLNRVQPFVRYEIDDVITISPDPCPCGNKLPLISSIEGRANDQFWIHTHQGTVQEMSNFIFKDAYLSLLEIAEYQVIQVEGRNRFQLLIQLVPGAALTKQEILNAVNTIVKNEDVPAELDMEVIYVEQIPRDVKSGKVRRFINKAGKPG